MIHLLKKYARKIIDKARRFDDHRRMLLVGDSSGGLRNNSFIRPTTDSQVNGIQFKLSKNCPNNLIWF